MPATNVKNITGIEGGVLITPSSGQVTGKFNAVQFTQNSIISTYEGNIKEEVGTFTNLGMPAGFTLFGITTKLALSSGSAIAYIFSE